ncbi:MAG: hypothetical protein OP8BY_1886 [Candidatus Saccharicenans subterraneus]|uniref:Uncharacterized protein n=1 Tax=Candidatus Saccharicenans subterraneus TaxID=2508984 RepID=A0A3E2BNQ2_9BACT|nr:MAG: hypothetical protein OP8BY_1886 [Candidatus Saccharicenans subterraneum]
MMTPTKNKKGYKPLCLRRGRPESRIKRRRRKIVLLRSSSTG